MNKGDFWRHILIGAAVAGASAILQNLSGDNFGQYNIIIQLAVQAATEALNQVIGKKA